MPSVTSEFDARMEIKAFIDRSRAPYETWYAGVAADPEDRLFNYHGVQENDWFIHRLLASAESARKVEQYLLKQGCQGGESDEDDETTTSVYSYWKRDHTTP